MICGMKENKIKQERIIVSVQQRLGFALKVTFEEYLTEAREHAIWIIWENVMLEKVVQITRNRNAY